MYLNTLRYIQFESNVHFSQLSNYQIHKFERKRKDHLTILFDRKISTKLKISIVFSSCLFHVMHNECVLYCFLSKIYFFSFFLFFCRTKQYRKHRKRNKLWFAPREARKYVSYLLVIIINYRSNLLFDSILYFRSFDSTMQKYR